MQHRYWNWFPRYTKRKKSSWYQVTNNATQVKVTYNRSVLYVSRGHSSNRKQWLHKAKLPSLACSVKRCHLFLQYESVAAAEAEVTTTDSTVIRKVLPKAICALKAMQALFLCWAVHVCLPVPSGACDMLVHTHGSNGENWTYPYCWQ